MKKTIFLTGLTGFLGSNIAVRLLQNDEVSKLVVLVRGSSMEEATRRALKALTLADPQFDAEQRADRLVVLSGDITESQLGLSDSSLDLLSSQVTHVIHCAACVDFGQSLENARRINVMGTKEVMNVARNFSKLERIAYIGTAYVAGERSGLVYEQDLDAGQSFGNYYEQSKFEAEQYVRSLMSTLPIDVFRPSIVVGDSQTGRTTSFNVLYAPLRAIYNGYIPVLPGSRSTLLDVVPVDFVANAICDITLRNDRQSGRIFHLTAGEENLVSVGDLVDYAVRYFNSGGKNISRVRFVSSGLFRTVAERTGRALGRIAGAMETYIPYMSRNVVFDNRNTRELLHTSVLPKSLLQYYDVILDYCIQTNWGRQFRMAA
jgi:thioester reductase-like protein